MVDENEGRREERERERERGLAPTDLTVSDGSEIDRIDVPSGIRPPLCLRLNSY
jgi:hypothetical protein